MTRKKFVKQLMALGYQRNHAEGMAMYARWTGCTYEDYLRDEITRINFNKNLLNIKVSLVDYFTPVFKAAQQAVERLREAVAGIKWNPPDLSALSWATEQVEEAPLPQWPKENPHRCDVLDAMAYNMQVMSRADHDALHGYVCGIDLAHGPDFSAGGGGV